MHRIAAKKVKSVLSVYATILMAVMISVFLVPADSFAWWNDQWQYRRKIAFDTTAAGADVKENLSDIPLLIRLHTGNFNFLSSKQNGEDIRFVAADDAAMLPFHIEKYDTIDEMAVIWVKIPRLSGNVNQEFIWMYYGNPDAMGGQDAKAGFDSLQIAAWHMAELEGLPRDATANALHAAEFAGGQGLPGLAGNGIMLGGGKDKMVVKHAPAMNFSGGMTFSAWVRIAHPQQNGYLFSIQSVEKKIIVGVEGTKVYADLSDSPGAIAATERTADLSLEKWHYVAAVFSPQNRITIYIDGIESTFTAISSGLPLMETDIVIGSSVSGENAFAGEMDEVRIAGAARTADWLRAEYASQGPEASLYVVGEEAAGSGAGIIPVFYLATIMKNITLDGWAIIGCLVVMGMAGWFIILSKSFYIYLVEKENRQFLTAYAQLDDPTELMSETSRFANSVLFTVYEAGCRKLNDRLAYKRNTVAGSISRNAHPVIDGDEILGARSLNSVRSTLERGYIEQTQKLNDWLVVLTLGISGGPFLGLLGTVWGVMSTFAAMAEAGEANIMAIAPGVASALSTTVVGLLVAIPALFGYNYITGKIKCITADLTVFVDQYIMMVEEKHGRTS